jgi:uncharacterized protein (TIGR03437 family)
MPVQPHSQIYALAPVRLFGSSEVRVAVTIGDQISPVETVNVAVASPGIFNLPLVPIVHGADQTRLVTTADPAARGEIVVMYVAGLGQTTPPPIGGDGAPLDVLAWTVLPLTVRVGGVEATNVQFKGLTPTTSGLYQINFQVPASLPSTGSVDLEIETGGRRSNVVKIAVR